MKANRIHTEIKANIETKLLRTDTDLFLGLEMLQPINHREKWLMTVEICFVWIDQTNGSPPNEIYVFTVIFHSTGGFDGPVLSGKPKERYDPPFSVRSLCSMVIKIKCFAIVAAVSFL